jgi:Gpi18-like mannosyltransferase
MALLLGTSLLAAPWIFFWFDVIDCWLYWGRASGGTRPWDSYHFTERNTCNYPAFCLYLLTLVERIRLWLGLSPAGTSTIVLVKTVMILPHVAGSAVCWLGLRRLWGETWARRTALLFAVSPALFVNAALWGQWDALLSLALLATVVFLLQERPVWAGAAMGWALTIKLQAIMIAPVVLVYAFRRFGARTLAAGIVAALLTGTLITLPFLMNGTLKMVLWSYHGAPDTYPYRTVGAMNVWSLANGFETRLRNVPISSVDKDSRSAFYPSSPFTYKRIGLLLASGYLLFLLIPLWRNPRPETLILAAGLSFFGFFMLATQMHERYSVPAAALLALAPAAAAGGTGRQGRHKRWWYSPSMLLFLAINVTAAVNMALILCIEYFSRIGYDRGLASVIGQQNRAFFWGSLLNCLLLGGASLLYLKTANRAAESQWAGVSKTEISA